MSNQGRAGQARAARPHARRISGRWLALGLAMAVALSLVVACGCARRAVEKGVLLCAGDWDMPPAFHGNPWAPGGTSVANGFVYEPLFLYVPASRRFEPRLGESFDETADGLTLRVRLRTGVKWHDGGDFSSQDVRATFYTGYLKGLAAWGNLADIECPDSRTVIFHWRVAADSNRIKALTEYVTSPQRLFGTWADRIPELLALRPTDPRAVVTADDPALQRAQKMREDLFRFHPPMPVGTGPFRLSRVTASDLILERFAEHYDAPLISVRRVHVMRWGSNQVIWSYLMAGEVDAAGAACPYDVSEELMRRNPRMGLMRASDRNEFGLVFNCSRPPGSDPAFRRAVALALDRDAIRKIANSYATTVSDYSLGLLDSERDAWLPRNFLKTLTPYHRDPARAREILLQAGYRWDTASRRWSMPDGSPLQVEILAPTGMTDIVLLAEGAVAQLSDFGVAAEVRVAPQDLYGGMLADRRFDIAASFGVLLGRFDDPGTCLGRFFYPGAQLKMACGLPDVLEFQGKQVDTAALVRRLDVRLSDEERRQIVGTLAGIMNEHLPFLTCFEKNLTVYRLDGVRVTGWPAADDPLWSAGCGGFEAVLATMAAKGMLRPAP